MLASRHLSQMKWTWGLIWILTAFVVFAGVDRVPDPPSAKPDTAQFRISGPHDLAVAFAIRSRLLICAFWQAERSAGVAQSEPILPINRVEPLERATDPSPPALLS